MRRSRCIASAAGLGLLLALTASCGAGSGGLPDPPEGWYVAFADDFDGPAGTLPASEHWRFSLGHGYPDGPEFWGTGEVAYHTDDPANVSVDGDGRLLITPRRDADGGWTSARIETQRSDFRPPPGGAMRLESRLQIPDVTGDAARGYWPAFWALGAPYRAGSDDYPGLGEIDVMENVNGVDAVWGTLHCGDPAGGPCRAPDGLGASRPCPDAPCPGHFHTFSVEWDTGTDPHRLRWLVDGTEYHAVSRADLPGDVWDRFAGHEGFFLLLNLAIGGGFPDGVAGVTTPTAATEPDHPLVVDYVAVWYRDG